MPAEITMPQQSDTMTEGTVVRWLKKEGEKVKAGEIIAEIETDKAVMEMEAFEAGTLAAIVVAAGQKAPVGGVIAVLAGSKDDPGAIKKQYAGGAAKSAAPAPAAAPAAVGAGAAHVAASPRTATSAGRVPPPAPQGGSAATLEGASMGEIHEPDGVGHGATREAPTAVPAVPHGGNGNGNGDRIFASPLARRIAADKGIDLHQVQGSGPGGRIVQRDVLEYAKRPTPPAPAQKSPAGAKTASTPLPQRVARGQTEVIPFTNMRRAIALGLQRSKQNLPHFYVSVDVDVEDLMALRGRLNKQLESEGVKLSLNDFVSRAVTAALLRHPALNAHLNGEKGEITRFGDVNLGIAVAIPDGLIVPVMRNADQMGLKELQQRTAELAKKAKAQKLKGDEMKGATFTISNLGMFGVKEFSAIINPPEVGILAVSAAEKRPVVRGDQIVARTTMTLTLSVDHRAVDGATAAEFLRTLKGFLEEPGMMLV